MTQQKKPNGTRYLWTTDEQAMKHANKSRSRAIADAKRHIEGEYLTSMEIAERLGISATTARNRIAKAVKLPGPLTWEKLGATVDTQSSAAILAETAEQ